MRPVILENGPGEEPQVKGKVAQDAVAVLGLPSTLSPVQQAVRGQAVRFQPLAPGFHPRQCLLICRPFFFRGAPRCQPGFHLIARKAGEIPGVQMLLLQPQQRLVAGRVVQPAGEGLQGPFIRRKLLVLADGVRQGFKNGLGLQP